MNETYIDIKRIAEIKGLKSTRSIRIAIQKGKYIAREIKVNGGTSYEILYSSLEPEIQERLEDEEIKSTALIPVENKINFISENAKMNALARVDIVTALMNIRTKYPTKKEADDVFLDLYNSGLYLPQIFKFVGTISIGTLHRWVTHAYQDAEEYSSGQAEYWDNEESRKIFSSFPRYKSHLGHYAQDNQDIAKEYNGVTPLVRWISTPWVEFDAKTGHPLWDTRRFRTSEEFTKNLEIGKDYVLPVRQSCSKKFEYAYGDNLYGDNNSSWDIKFIFIPKSKNGSRAVDILDSGYKGYDCEAIYLPGEKFVILDKRIEEVVVENNKAGEIDRSFYRWVIEMQEK